MPVDPRVLRRRPNELGADTSPPSAPLLPGGPGPTPQGAGFDPSQIVQDPSQLGPDMFDMQGSPLPMGAGDDQAGGMGPGMDPSMDPSMAPGQGEMMDNEQVAANAPDPGMAAEPGRMAAAIGQMIAQAREQQIQQIDQQTEAALQHLTQIMHQAASVNPTLDESALPQATPSPSGY